MSVTEAQLTSLVESDGPALSTLILAVLAPFIALGLTAMPLLVESAKHALAR